MVLGWLMGALIAVVAFTSGLTWIMGSDRTLAVSCYDGAGPRGLGTFSARFGTPVRVNILSGFVSTGVFILAETITRETPSSSSTPCCSSRSPRR